MRRYILGTAGHVDHGKTELVKALTGRDTDRLREEKERGISIDLGFAPLALDENTFVGIVDVPGHERFIKNMVAGAGGIDLALLLVAADEGVMPQTREHLEVLNSLAISEGIVVVSKIDLATGDMRMVLLSEIKELVEGTFLQSAPVMETSAKSGTGLKELKKKLLQTCRRISARDASGPFRLPVDRIFLKRGIGMVVTGSCISGTAAVGDYLDLLPSGKRVRIREIQSFNDKRTSGHAGERLAIALQGIKAGDAKRGDVLVTPSKFHASILVDARIRIADYGSFELKNRERVRLHHGAKEVMGRVLLLDREELCSGESALAQFKLENPIVADEGDFFVMRKYSPQRVLGGGRILDPAPSRHRRHDDKVLASLSLLEGGDSMERLLQVITEAGLNGLSEGEIPRDELEEVLTRGDVIPAEGRLFHAATIQEFAKKVYRIAKEYNDTHPLLYGIDKEELRQKTGVTLPKAVFNSVLDALRRFQPIFIQGNQIRAEDESSHVRGDLKQEVESLEELLKQAGFFFLSLGEIEARWLGKSSLQEALQYLKSRGKIEKIGDKGFIHNSALEQIKRSLAELFEEKEQVTVGDFKDKYGLTRKHAIPLLEFFDEKKFTLRRENIRLKGPGLNSGR